MKSRKMQSGEDSRPDSRKSSGRYILRIYVTGLTPNSARAVTSLKPISESELAGHYKLPAIDLYLRPEPARSGQIIAAPTPVENLPLPLRRPIGDFPDRERVLIGLDLRPVPPLAPRVASWR